MEQRVIVVCTVVGLLGLLSAATGIVAEFKRIKESQVRHVTSPYDCSYPRSLALPLGIIAVAALGTAQLIISIETGCICCKRNLRPSNSNWTLTLVCFILSWFTFVIAFLLLITGAALNDQHGEGGLNFGHYYCYVVKPGIFTGASVLSLASVVFGIVYYLTLTTAKIISNPWGSSTVPNQDGIGSPSPTTVTHTVPPTENSGASA